MLIVIGGLPGTGKTTISRALALRLGATYLRIDAIEQAIRGSGVVSKEVGPAGDCVANAIAEANLIGGRTVIADCVNPVAESRAGWREVAARAAARLIEVEIVCSDRREHRRRVEQRVCDIPGLAPPTWPEVMSHAHEPWSEAPVVLDTDVVGVDEAVATLFALASVAGNPDRCPGSGGPTPDGLQRSSR